MVSLTLRRNIVTCGTQKFSQTLLKMRALVLILSLALWSSSTVNARSAVRNPNQISALCSCLADAGVDVDATLFEYDTEPGSQYTFYNYQWEILNPTKTPAAYFVVRSASDVQAGVRCAKPLNIPLVPKGGGHSYEKYSYGTEESVIVDMQKLDQLDVNEAESVFKVGAGALLAQIAYPLYSKYNFVTPHGTCPTVGIAGLALGGGYGYLSRLHGLTTDQVVEFEMVNAAGDLLVINGTTNTDLFWALKGAGAGSFGIVTSMKMKAYEAPEQIVFGYAHYPLALFPLVFAQWQRFLYTFYPKEINTKLSVNKGKVVLEVFEVQQHPEEGDDVLARVRAFIQQFPYTLDVHFEQYNYPDFMMKTMHATAYGVTHPSEFEHLTRHSQSLKRFKAKSFFGSRSATEEDMQAMLEVLERITSVDDIIVELYALGGQINDPEAYGQSSFMHRAQSMYIAQIFYEWKPETSTIDHADRCVGWVREFTAVAGRAVGGTYSYQNYADADLDDYLERYYGWHLNRLSQIKRNVDPTNFFRHPQSIPVSTEEE